MQFTATLYIGHTTDRTVYNYINKFVNNINKDVVYIYIVHSTDGIVYKKNYNQDR